MIRVCENIQVVYVKFSSNRHIIDDIVEAHCCVVITSELILMSKDVAESIYQITDCRTFWPHRPYVGETKRTLTVRRSEYRQADRRGDPENGIAVRVQKAANASTRMVPQSKDELKGSGRGGLSVVVLNINSSLSFIR